MFVCNTDWEKGAHIRQLYCWSGHKEWLYILHIKSLWVEPDVYNQGIMIETTCIYIHVSLIACTKNITYCFLHSINLPKLSILTSESQGVETNHLLYQIDTDSLLLLVMCLRLLFVNRSHFLMCWKVFIHQLLFSQLMLSKKRSLLLQPTITKDYLCVVPPKVCDYGKRRAQEGVFGFV